MVASERVGHRLRWGGICLRFGSFNSSWTRSISIVQGLVIEGGIHVEVLNAISLHGGLPGSWPCREITAKIVVPALIERWRQVRSACQDLPSSITTLVFRARIPIRTRLAG